MCQERLYFGIKAQQVRFYSPSCVKFHAFYLAIGEGRSSSANFILQGWVNVSMSVN